jgi:hypothetical protein
MVASALAVTVTVPATSAQTERQVEIDANAALAAALGGNCVAALESGKRVETADAAYWRVHLASHPAMIECDPALAPPTQRPARPPLTVGRIVGQLVVGGALGFAGIISGALVGGGVGGAAGDDLAGAVIGGYTTMVIGLPLGVHLIARYGDRSASFGATLAGSLLPAAAGGGIMLAAAAKQSDPLLAVGVGVGFAGPVIGSMVASIVTRRWDDDDAPQIVPTVSTANGGAMLGFVGQF